MPHNILSSCILCPRECRADRLNKDYGFCKSVSSYEISSICLHKGEEPILGGEQGVCNIFFYHCNLQCVYCQNYQISRNTAPTRIMELDKIVSTVSKMLGNGVDCVGFVSPSHMIEQTKEIISALNRSGFKPTTIMNTNAYDKKETIESLCDSIDVYLPDFKYMDSNLARTYSGAEDYPETALRALREMYRQKGAMLSIKENGTIGSGLIIRHLILPGEVENSKACLRAIAEELSPSVHISIMAQYYPVPAVKEHPKLGRRITREEYEEVLDEFYSLGFHCGWTQELESHKSYRPDFSKHKPFV